MLNCGLGIPWGFVFVIENVIPYYEPLIQAQKRGRHLYWANFIIPNNIDREESKGLMCGQSQEERIKLCKLHKIKESFLDTYKGKQSKLKIIRNLVDYKVGEIILNAAMGIINKQNQKQMSLL